MHKKSILWLVVIAVLLVIAWYFLVYTADEPKSELADVKNISFTINGRVVDLVNGRAESEIVLGSVSTAITQYFGNEARGDLNKEGKEDVAFIVTETTGGSGIFYYVVVALDTRDGYKGTNAVFLGDRIAPQTTEIRDGKLIVNYADRKEGEPMTSAPSLGVSKYLKVDGKSLVEI